MGRRKFRDRKITLLRKRRGVPSTKLCISPLTRVDSLFKTGKTKRLLSRLRFTRARFSLSLSLTITLCLSLALEMALPNCFTPKHWSQLEFLSSLSLAVLHPYLPFLIAKISKNSTCFWLEVRTRVRSPPPKLLKVVSQSECRASSITRSSVRLLAISVPCTPLPFHQTDSVLPQALRTVMCISTSCSLNTLPKSSNDHYTHAT